MSSSYVYLVRLGGAIKIGHSSDPEQRLKALATGSPSPPELVAVFEGDRRLEKALHVYFAHKRQHREWFALSDEDVLTIHQLVEGGMELPVVPPPADRPTRSRRHQAMRRYVLRRFRETEPDTYKRWLAEAKAEVAAEQDAAEGG